MKAKFPAWVAVPEIAPLDASVSPGGSEPERSDHEYGGTPPDASKVVVGYVALVEAPGKIMVVTASGSGAPIAMVSGCVAVAPVESVILIVKFEFVWAVGVPEMLTERVVLEPKDKPGVRDPAEIDHENGAVPPDALTVAE
jgi:hypothetical protein